MHEISAPRPDEPEEQDWGEARGHYPEGRTPVSRWPAPPESISAPAVPVPAKDDGPSTERNGPRQRLTALLVSFRDPRKRS